MTFGFDAPENPVTVIDANLWIVGKKFAMVEKYMKSTYTEISFGSDYDSSAEEPQYWELKLKMSS